LSYKQNQLDDIFVLYTTCQTNKNNLIGSLLHFYKNEEEKNVTFGICFRLLQISIQICKTLTFTLKVFVL